jgi:CheY-like chemotaxis protein
MPDPVTVLVVDDEPSICDIVRKILEPKGYTVRVARHGLQALQVLSSEAVDCVIADLVMPSMDGITLAMKLHENYPNLPTVLISGQVDVKAASIQALAPLLNSDTSCLLKKPFESADLLEAVQRALGRARR